jgi:alkanesulfonate monooxygenase SsuD/methylene tetrahydromethanopterin reductase-like flavin-dependent oxidoreductase (luciferase family)
MRTTLPAAHTSTVRLGALRQPGLLAKIATTLDALSGGRATLGIGNRCRWYDREHHGLSVPYPSTAERFERLEETLKICLQMWDSQDDGPFEGKHYKHAFTTDMAQYAELGVDTVILMPPEGRASQWVEQHAGPAVARLTELS